MARRKSNKNLHGNLAGRSTGEGTLAMAANPSKRLKRRHIRVRSANPHKARGRRFV